MKNKIFSGILAAATAFSSVGMAASKPEAKAAYSCDFEKDYAGFTDFFTTNVPDGMSIEDGALKLTGGKNVWSSAVSDFDEVTVIEYDFMQKTYSSRGDNSPIRVKVITDSAGKAGWRHLLTYGNSNEGKFANGAYTAALTPETWYSVKYVIYPSGETTSDAELFFGTKDSGLKYIGNTEMSKWLKITQFQIFNLAEDLYLDNFSVASYSKEAYTEINKCTTADDVKAVLDFYMSNKLMAKNAFDLLSDADKHAVCADIAAAAPYASAAEFDAAFDGFIAARSDGATIYYKWDFENGSLADYATGTEFMTGNSPSKGCVSVANDPNAEAVNSAAKIDLSTADEKLVSTSAVKDDLANVRYVVYDAKVYHNVYNANNEQQNLEFQVRYAAGTRKPLMLFQLGRENRWNIYKTVVDTKEQKEYGYIYLNGDWMISNSGLNGTDMTAFDPDQLRIRDQANNGTVYFDDVIIKGYKNLYEEVNAAAEDNVCHVLEAFDAMQVIDLAGYADLDNSEKALLAAYIKSETYTDDAGVKAAAEKAVSILSSEDELVILSSEVAGDALTDVTVAINTNIADDVTAAETKLFIASYASDRMLSVRLVDVTGLDRLSEISATGLGLNLASATKVKYMLWKYDNISPLAQVNTVNLPVAE